MEAMAIEEGIMDAMVEGPREKLRQILEKNGEAILQDPARVEGLLRDHCGSFRKEISALVGALNERVPLELKGSWQTAMTPEAMRARLVQRMEDNRGLAPEVAEWSVDTWSYALGIGLGRRSDRLQSVVLGGNSQLNGAAGNQGGLVSPADTTSGSGRVQGQVRTSEAERQAAIASDRPGGSRPAAVGLLATAEQKKKAGIGAGVVVALALVGAFGYAMHKPTPTPIHEVTPSPAPAPDPTPAPHAATGDKPDPSIPTHADATISTHGDDSIQTNGDAATAGTPLQIRLNQGISSDKVKIGETFSATLAAPLWLNGKTVVPQGSDATIRVVNVQPGGRFKGQTQMQLALVKLSAGGKDYKVSAANYTVLGPKQATVAATHTGVGAAVGAVGGFLTGKLFHHGKAGALAGAGAGGGIGAATTKPQPAKVLPEQVIHFRLIQPMAAKA